AKNCYVQEEGLFPPILVGQSDEMRLFLKVESVADFLSVWQFGPIHKIEGLPLAPLRRARVSVDQDAELWLIERHGYSGFEVTEFSPERLVLVLKHLDELRRRPRDCQSDSEGFDQANMLIDAAIADLGVDRVCELFFIAEREYWQRRNRAGQ